MTKLPSNYYTKRSNFESVGQFMKTFGQEVKTKPEMADADTCHLRLELISEEVNELYDALKDNDIVAVADALTDILYVTYGAGHAFGIDLDKCFTEVQRSNMSKLGEDDKPIYREDGKVMKGPNFSEPDLENILQIE